MKVGTDGVLLGAWAAGGARILDVGTGTGVVALMMAQRFPEASVSAIELEAEAVRQALENVAASPFSGRIEVAHVALQQYEAAPFDAIVVNPPFFSHALAAQGRARAMARQTDSLSFRELCRGGRRLLAEGGVMSLIIPADRCGELEAEAVLAGFFLQHKVSVKTTERKQPKRCLLALGTRPASPFRQETLTLMENGHPTPWYESLLSDFLLSRSSK